MDGKLLECIFLIMSAFMVLPTSSSEDPRVNDGSEAACTPGTEYNPVNVININGCSNNTEGDGQLREDIREIESLLSDLISRLENGAFCCDGSVEQVGEETEEVEEETDEVEVEEDVLLKDCYDIKESGETESGIYKIQPNGSFPFDVYCDMETDSGGWTVFQRREDGSVDFYLTWQDYKNGFGSVSGEHWLGNENLYYLSNQKTYELRVDLGDFEDNTRYAVYQTFLLAPESDNYRLSLGALAAGDAGDGMGNDNGQQFSTYDADHDSYDSGNCAERFTGAWWYLTCHTANLNGRYLRGTHTTYANGVEWEQWTGYYYSLRFTEMKLRPI